MHKSSRNLTVSEPTIRFPEFKGNWQEGYAGELFHNRAEKGRAGLAIYSVTMTNGLVKRDSLERHMKPDAATEKNQFAASGDLVYNTMRMWQGAVGLSEQDCMVSPAYNVLVPVKGKTSSSFFLNWVERPEGLYRLWAYSYGLTSDRLRLYYKDFAVVPVTFPSLEEQIKIADFLGFVDERIQGMEKKKTLLEQYKKGVMQKLFSQQIRFVNIDGKPFSDWEDRKLSELLYEHKVRNYEGKFDKFDVLSVSGDAGIVNQIEHLGRSYAGENLDNYHVVHAGDIVYTKSPLKSNPYGIIKANKGKAGIVSTLYAVYSCRDTIVPEYLDYYFSLDDNINRYLRPLVHKGAKNDMKINNQRVLVDPICIPCPDEQKKIASFLSSIDEKIAIIADQLSAIKAFKKGLLQNMFV